MPGTAPPKYHGRSFTGGGAQLLISRTGPRDSVPCMYTTSFFYSTLTYQGDGREEALLKHLQSLPELSTKETSNLSLQDKSQRVLDAIHEFGKGENRYLMSVGETKGKQVEQLIKDKKRKVGICSLWSESSELWV